MRKKVLVIAAHPDDETLGCGGTLLKLKKKKYEIKIIFMTDGVNSRNNTSNKNINFRKNCTINAMKKYGITDFIFHDYPDNQMDKLPLLEIVKNLEQHIFSFKPSIVFTHHYNDLNIDHKITFQAAMTCLRSFKCSFLESFYSFEIPSSTEQNLINYFKPNCYSNISNEIDKKISIFKLYKDEINKFPHPRSSKYIKILSEFRGAQINVAAAEAFEAIKLKIFNE